MPVNGRDYVKFEASIPASSDSAPAASSMGAPPQPVESTKAERNSSPPPISKPNGDAGSEIAKLAIVVPLPYTFSGASHSQFAKPGRLQPGHEPASSVAGGPGANSQAGTTGFEDAPDLFQAAMSSYVDKDYVSAANLLNRALELDPEMAQASLYLGICRLLQGKREDAVEPLKSASNQKRAAIAQPAHFYLAKAYLQLGRIGDAEIELQSAANLPGRLSGEANGLLQRLQAIRQSTGD
jgi:TolA-binding protein